MIPSTVGLFSASKSERMRRFSRSACRSRLIGSPVAFAQCVLLRRLVSAASHRRNRIGGVSASDTATSSDRPRAAGRAFLLGLGIVCNRFGGDVGALDADVYSRVVSAQLIDQRVDGHSIPAQAGADQASLI